MNGKSDEMKSETLSRRELFRKTARFAAGAFIGTCAGLMIFRSRSEATVLRIDHTYDKTDEFFKETRRISLHGFMCTGIATGPGGRLHAAGPNTLLLYAEVDRLRKRVELEGEATSIASDLDGTLFIGMTDHVEVYDQEGKRKDIWSSLGENAFITSVAVSKESVYLADTGNRLVMGFTKTGRLQTIIGKRDREGGASGFVIPSPYFDVSVGKDQTLWAANTGLKKLENYTPDGVLCSAWGTSSDSIEGFCGCCNPSHFAILPDGSFVTSEKGIPRVKLYDPKGNFVETIAGPERFEPRSVGLDIAVGGQDEILVLYPQGGVVIVYERKRQSYV